MTALCALLFSKLEEGCVWHHYLAQWQSNVFRQVKEHIGPDVLVLIVDFAENLDIRTNFSIMQDHWSHPQVSIFCAVAFFANVYTGEVVQEAHAIWSDSKCHDCVFSHLSIKKIVQTYTSSGRIFNNVLIFSDGCAAQFKCADFLLEYTKYFAVFDIELLVHNYFATSHGQ